MRVLSLLLGLSLATTVAHAKPGAPTTRLDQIAPEGQTVEVNLDLHIQPAILVRFTVPPSANPNQAASELENRYNQILTDNQPLNRFIQPDDIVIYAPVSSVVKPSPRRPHARHTHTVLAPAKPTSYAIYVLGRRLLSIDAATAIASGGASPRLLAIRWARQLQQSLPQLCWRPPALSDPPVASDPPLIITTDLAQVGGDAGDVQFHGKRVFTLHGVQPGDKTAIDRAEALSHRLALLAVRYGNDLPADQLVEAQPDGSGGVTLSLGQSSLVTITPVDARANGVPSAQALAERWAAALNRAWHSQGQA